MVQDKNRKDDEEIYESGQEPEEGDVQELATDIEAMQAELDQLRKDVEEAHDRYLRTYADFDNFRKRQREEMVRRDTAARADVIEKIFPVMDNFQRALKAAEEQHSYESLVEGVNLTLRQMSDILEREGVKPIEAVGQPFNPELHEAIATIPSEEHENHTVIEEVEKGYTLNDRVLRPARVVVSVSSAE